MNLNYSKLLINALLLICLISANFSTAVSQTAGNKNAKPVEVQKISVDELKAKIAKKAPLTIIDVRSSKAYFTSENRIKGSVHYKSRKLVTFVKYPPLNNIPRDREIVTYCSCPDEKVGIEAARTFRDAGFKNVRVLKGGWNEWVKANGPVEPRPQLSSAATSLR